MIPSPKTHLRLTWEDGVFLVLTLSFLLTSHGPFYFHFYTLGVVILVLSLSFRRGLAVGAVRMVALSLVLLFLQTLRGEPLKVPLLEIAGMTVGGLVSGLVGEMHRKSQDALKRSFAQTMDVLARSLECRDPYTQGHSRRTAEYALAIADEMGFDEAERETIEHAGLLHDLGKIGVPDAVLRKKGALTPEEQSIIRRHPEEGSRILRDIPALAKAATWVRHHHEHVDGTGYPDQLVGNAIPLGARILSVADALDALTTERPYRQPVSRREAIDQMQKEAGRLFDPEVLSALSRVAVKRGWNNSERLVSGTGS